MKKFLSVLLSAFMLMPALALAHGVLGLGELKKINLSANSSVHGELKGDKKDVNMAVRETTTTGTVTSVSGTTINITSNSTSFVVDASAAKLLRKFGATMTVADIQNGDSLVVQGTVTGTNIVAKNIRDNSLQQRNATFSGIVSSVSGASFVLATKERGNQTVNTNSSTEFKKSGKAASFADIVANQNVTVSGVWDSTNNNITAAKINIVVKNINVTGIVQSIAGQIITLTKKNSTSTVYTADATNAKLARRFGAAMVIGDIQNGDTLTVNGTIIGTNIVAKTIRNESLQAHNGTFVGTISALSGTSFTLQSKERGNQTINTTATTKFKKGNASSTISDLAVGETVTVSGVWDRTNSNVTANRITIKIPNVTITGTLSAISGTMLTVNASSTNYSINTTGSKIIFVHGHSGSLTTFQVNDQVKVWGTQLTPTANVSAKIVQDLSRTYNNSTSTPSH